jgi:DNA (cytosine-5)-methyltransferase 1
MNCITTATTKDNLIKVNVSILDNSHKNEGVREYFDTCPTLNARDYKEPRMVNNGYSIRRLTPKECFNLMDFNESFTWSVSDSQAYKQAGNSIVVGVLAKLISKLNLPIKTT